MCHRLLAKLGKEPLCNGRPDRAPHIGNFCFPLCWRCFSFLVGAIFASAIKTWVYWNNTVMVMIYILLAIPCLLDGGIQYLTEKYESTNMRRSIFGFMAGVGARMIAYSVIGV